ncbi:NTP pyrophosphohydrolase [Saccharothrix yanglingensis]|uniref:NTP pyrophosphohydrolase n=1 Tax=Saccharothrix yanglingensis TaxID=659496 RepID=A0ABU0WSX3_9PSEU|nr:NTP pyrophosphohydrolase [Saccharothrix yanglingensis]MDQ2582941.1 NTP pyrophosphohydrolase [Saccharothrix yanglingensis]
MRLPLLVVDAANVVGSVPDGWWRDRAGATTRLRDNLVGVAEHGLPSLPGPLEVVLVVEGKARHVAPVPGVRVVPATGDGDDEVVAVVRAEGADRPVAVATADRALRLRVEALGAAVVGPRSVRWRVPRRTRPFCCR